MTFWRPLFLFATTLLISTARAQEIVSVDAVSGGPLGVAEVTLRWPGDEPACYWLAGAVVPQALDGNLYFPVTLPRVPPDSPVTVFQGGPPGGIPRRLSLLFLFRGNDPFTVQVPALGTTRIAIDPKDNPAKHRRLFQRWWREFSASRRYDLAPSASPEVVTRILAQRFGLQLAERPANTKAPSPLDLLFGTADDSRRLGGNRKTERLPVATVSFAEPSANVAAGSQRHKEPLRIADVVPAECFFVGCDTFSQMMWWMDYLELRQRQLGPLIRLRGDNPRTAERIRTQLGVLELPIPEEMADHFIGSIAAIGMDFNLEDGPALGVVLQSKNPALGMALVGLRNQIALKEPQATIKTISLEGTSVSRLATPDNRIRSFYVVKGNFHLVTNCQELARRFLQCDPSTDSLGGLPEFQALMQPSRHNKNDLVCFVPTQFQQDLCRVDRWLETQRRSAARRDAIELLVADRLSKLVGEDNGQRLHRDDSGRVAVLIESGWLPEGWCERIDDSQALIRNDLVQDSLRGAIGSFLPVPDVKVTSATQDELERHQHVQQFLDTNWGEPPPISARLSRTVDPTSKQRDVISVRLELAPLRPQHHTLLRQFVGDPVDDTMLPDDGFAVAFEWMPPDRPLLGLEDRRLVIAIPNGAPSLPPPSNQLLAQLMALRTLPLVIASSPDDSLLMRFDPIGRLRPLEDGETTRGALGMYRRKDGGWYSISYDAQALDDVTSRMVPRPAERAGQARFTLSDPSQSRLATWFTAVTHDRLRRASLQSARAMNLITHDLQLPARDRRRITALLLGAEQECPLGGDWQWIPVTSTTGGWIPSVPLVEVPPRGNATNWEWLNELQAACELHEDTFVVHAQWIGLATRTESP